MKKPSIPDRLMESRSHLIHARLLAEDVIDELAEHSSCPALDRGVRLIRQAHDQLRYAMDGFNGQVETQEPEDAA
jgi:hypothetical protein